MVSQEIFIFYTVAILLYFDIFFRDMFLFWHALTNETLVLCIVNYVDIRHYSGYDWFGTFVCSHNHKIFRWFSENALIFRWRNILGDCNFSFCSLSSSPPINNRFVDKDVQHKYHGETDQKTWWVNILVVMTKMVREDYLIWQTSTCVDIGKVLLLDTRFFLKVQSWNVLNESWLDSHTHYHSVNIYTSYIN